MKLDKNGYVPSIMVKDPDICCLCGRGGDMARHEIYFGPNRQASKANGFWVTVCPACHNMIHRNRKIDLELKKMCQSHYEESHTRAEFMALIGRNYLEDDDEGDITETRLTAGRIQHDVSDKGDGGSEW
jgi:hypothetical protein